ncbi:MAG: lipid IV(A) 3-deoxy-D-manno-octulosonic acid transferase [Gallionella sp.]|nr:lipid IV(A) 3-deoxy-D-manno-octulosonic acid transferase [Gallionella sp.]MDD4945464.1 lipid IV(A) 3-deoxy-D-manno-octulosonic acid transferase [Gallionella sp.]MDD5612493.1 lipid IV(A) 3-deoxy-D-manno-octulosonic acid transferase [Gallionella sp.]
MVRILYTLLLWLLLPFIFVRLALRARTQPEYLQHLGERFGRYSQIAAKPLIWLHAVSVGETRATVSLVAKLRATYPDHQILLTHTTPTGRATSEQLYGDQVMRVYLPYDYPFAVRRFLRHFRPKLGILMETEIWFNLIHEGHAAGVPMLLLNARLSEKSARGYARVARLTRNALGQLTAIAAQTPDDAARLAALGAQHVGVMGNLKFDIAPPAAMLERGAMLRGQFGAGRRVLLAASTREGEEALLLDALRACGGLGGALLVIVPRHPQRFDEIAGMLARYGLRCQRRSDNQAVAPEVQVVLGDSMGEMFAYYAAADLAYIGGSLLPFGGQNLIEACAVGTPVLIGPHTFNFADASKLAVEAGAALRVQDADQLFGRAKTLLADDSALADMRGKGTRFVTGHQGATDNAMKVISRYLAVR